MKKSSTRPFLNFCVVVSLLALGNLYNVEISSFNHDDHYTISADILDLNTTKEPLVSKRNDFGSRQTSKSKKNDKVLKRNSSNYQTNNFQWELIDPSKAGMCGFSKCFFRSKLRPDPHDFDFGYLVAYKPNTKDCNLTLGWEMAKHLEATYDLQHLYDAPPERIPVTPQLVRYTEKEISLKVKQKFYVQVFIKEFIQRLRDKDYPTSLSKQKESIFEVQRVRIPRPRPILEWGDNGKRNRKCREEFPKFLSAISNKATFGKNLLRQIKSLAAVLEKEPWIIHDFQVLIDQKGNILHIDLDRKPAKMKMNASALELKQESAMNALKVIAVKVISAANENDILEYFSKEDMSKARDYAQRFRKKIC